MDWYAHWVREGGDGSVIVDTGSVQGVEEINEPVVYEFFQIEDKLTNCSRYLPRVVPPENMNDGALINGVVRVDYLRGGKSEERVDGNEHNADRITMNGTPPLKVMIRSDEKRGSDISFPKGREGSIIGLVNQGEIGVADLETSQKSIIPSCEIYIRIGYK